MKIAKKSLSIFLALLMLFSACSVGLTGIVASAAAGDSKYTHDEVIELVNAATAAGFNLSSSNNEWSYTTDDGSVLNAAEAIFDYAVKTYREGKNPTDAGNNSVALYDMFDDEFSSEYTNAAAARQLVKNVINPDGAKVYTPDDSATKSTTLAESTTEYTKGADVSSSFPISSYPDMYASGVETGILTKTSFVQIDINKYLLTFDSIDDIPSSIITSVKYSFAHASSTTATVSNVTTRSSSSGCSTTTYYTPTITTSYFNYMSAKPVRTVTKNTTAKKQLLSYEKYFNADLLATTREQMLEMPLDEIQALYKTSSDYYNVMVVDFADVVLNHFNLDTVKIAKFMEDAYFAYRVVAGIYNIDILNNYIGSEYNVESYSEMSTLYTKVSTAYDVVYTMDTEIINYIINEAGYSAEYDSAMALKATAEAYNATLYDIMTEQRLEELVASMIDTYTEYIDVLDKEDIENPSDAEVIGLVQKTEGYDAVLALYPEKPYYRNYWTTDYEAAWATFEAKLAEVADVRGLKMEFETYYSYFMPIIFTTMIVDLDNDDAMSLHADMDTKLDELRETYVELANKWGYTIADKIFTINYEGSDYLLQTLIDSVKSTGKEALKQNLIDRTEAQLDAVYAYKDTTEVNFENFASIKSTLTHFDYDLYNYVIDNNLGLSSDYVAKYDEVQNLLDKYHAFTTTDGKSFFNESFTFADKNGVFANRYAGNQTVTDGEGGEIQLGYSNDIARDGEEDNYVVTEEKLLDTVVRIDNFITSRDFGALIGLLDENEEPTDLATYLELMLNEMLYTDNLINTLVGAIFPMIVDLIEVELINMLSEMGVNDNPAASACIDIAEMTDGDGSGHLYVYMDDDLFNGQHKQKYFADVFAEAGLYIYPANLADSLAMSNPSFYGIGTPIYTALKAAGRSWEGLVCEDDPDTIEVDETKVLDFEWGVYDEETFLDTLACIFDALLPLLNAVLTGTTFSETLTNAAYAYSTDTKYFISVGKLAVFGDLNLSIPGLTAYQDVLVPLFEVLGVENIPTLKQNSDATAIVNAIMNPLLGVIDRVLAAPLSTILDILPNLVYFLSMDSVQEMLNSININLSLVIEAEVDKDNSGTLVDLLGDTLLGLLGDMLSFDVPLNVADLLDLYDLLGFEISDFNDILNYVIPLLGVDISLPPIRQQDIIFCSDWGTNAAGRVHLKTNKGDLMYWFLDYVVKALVPDENGNSLLTALLGEDMDPAIKGIIEKVVSQITGNPNGALAAIIELLNPTTYDLEEMDWVLPATTYSRTRDMSQMSIVYLNYGNDWTREKAEYLVDNVNDILDTVLDLANVEMEDLGTMLQGMVNGLFTNANITALVEILGGFGDSPSGVITDVVKNQIGINLESWFIAFGYLFPEGTWAEDAEIIKVTDRQYVNNFGVEGVANEDGTISWFFNKMPLVDGDGYTFVNILSRLLGEASLVIEFLFSGEDISAFEDLLIIKGYETYDTSLGLLLEMLGVANLPTQADFNNDAMGSFTNMLTAVLDWFYDLTNSEDMIAKVIEIIPDLFYYIESNGLSTMLHNLLMSVWVIVDTVRPILDVDVNGVLSLIISEFLNYGTLNLDVILEYLVHGIYVNDDLDYVMYSVDLKNLTLSEIIKNIADPYIGTNLYESGLVQIGIKGFCTDVEMIENTSVGTIYKSTVDAADTLTIIVTAILDCLSQPAKAEGTTNGEALFGFISELTGNETIADIYPAIMAIIDGIEYEYDSPNWGYMFTSPDQFKLELPEQTIVYLGYTTDWDADTAANVYTALDDILDLVLPSLLEEGETIATLLNGLLEDNVYSDEILNTVVELIVNLIADFDATLFDLVDVVVDTDISTWFTFCELDETTGEYVCTYDWGVDEAEDKKAAFVAGIKEVLEPANSLLAWIFLGSEYEFFTSSEVDDEGNYTYSGVITINGGEGYAYGLVPLLEALGCTVPAPATFYDEATDTYNVGDAVAAILDSVLALVDDISANPVEEVFNLLPNLIYFINADGLVTSVNNLLAPVNAILAELAPVVGDVSIGGMLADAIGFDICNIDMATLLKIAVDNGIVVSDDIIHIIANLYVGKLAEFTSVNGRTAYRLDVTGYEGDVLTIILSLALDLFNTNATLFSDLLGEDIYWTVYNLIKGATEEFTYLDLNWGYMYEGETNADKLAALKEADGKLPERSKVAYDVYTTYQNNWNKKTADYVTVVLDTLVHDITTAVRSDGSSLGQILDQAIADGLYQDSILNSLIEMVVELLLDYEGIVKGAGALLGAEGLADWFDYCEITTDENGDTVVTCTQDWGIDAATTLDAKRKAFIDSFALVLEPAYDLLAWLFFADDYTFLSGTTGDALITIKGGRGYEEALIPLFEAVGVTMKGSVSETYLKGTSSVVPASYFYVDGKLDMEFAVKTIFGAVSGWLYDICGDLANQGEDGALTSMLERLPNLIYSINADGLKVVVNNLVAPVMYLLEAIEPMGVKVDFNELIGIAGFDIFNVNFDGIFALLEDLLGLYFPDYTQEFLKTFYIGELVEYKSANGETAYFMTYTEEESAAEMITCLIGFVVDAFQDERNPECLIDWMGEDIYNSIMAVLGIQGVKEMKEYKWLYTEYANTGHEFNATESSVRYPVAYNNIWTREKAEYISDNLIPFVNNILGLIGLELGGIEVKNADDLIDALLNGMLYTQDTVDSLIDLVSDLVAKLSDLEPYGEYITGILNTAFGVDLTAWDNMNIVVVDGDKDSFVAALGEILAPVVPLLDVLLCGENIELFYTIEPENVGKSALTIYGSEGYAYGIVPLFEALGCEMMDPETFKSIDNAAKASSIVESIINRFEIIAENPVDELFRMIPEIVYFINSNGLNASVSNILNSVDNVLIALEPIVGATSLMELLGVNIEEFDFEGVVSFACDAIEDSTGIDCEPLIIDFVAELTMGEVISYQSANGETYYKMVYAGEYQMVDMVTVVLRLLIDFLATSDNANAIIALIADNSESEDAANSASTLINFVLTAANTEPMVSGAMATLYYIFYGLNNGVEGIDTLYGNYGKSWDALVGFFEESDDSYYVKAAEVLKSILKEFGGVDTDSSVADCDCDCHNNSSFIRFFHKIITFLRKLFGMKEFQYCDCGTAHW